MSILDKVRRIADPMIAGFEATPAEINLVLRERLDIEIGQGGQGYDESVPLCRYCGATGGGGHGGFCPGPGPVAAQPTRDAEGHLVYWDQGCTQTVRRPLLTDQKLPVRHGGQAILCHCTRNEAHWIGDLLCDPPS